MRIQDHTTKVAREAAKEAFRYARAVPPDKLDWSPLDQGRTVISMCQEIAMCPSWAEYAISDAPFEWDEERSKEQGKVMAEWTDLGRCEREFEARFQSYADAAAELKEADLERTKWLPFNGGRDHTYLELLEYVRWNCTYHLGQIAYIQTLYGDKEMYS